MITPAVTLIDSMGDDLRVVAAARVSFARQPGNTLTDRDVRLIKFLARNGHWTPFAHPQVTFHIKAPIFVARQLARHQVGLVWNEVSGRYVRLDHEFWKPAEWRSAPESVKQGSGDPLNSKSQEEANVIYGRSINTCIQAYNELIELGVAKEQARAVLPLSAITEWYWTGSLAAWARVCHQRLDPHTQEETREAAFKIDREMETLFPYSWEALMNGG